MLSVKTILSSKRRQKSAKKIVLRKPFDILREPAMTHVAYTSQLSDLGRFVCQQQMNSAAATSISANVLVPFPFTLLKALRLTINLIVELRFIQYFDDYKTYKAY